MSSIARAASLHLRRAITATRRLKRSSRHPADRDSSIAQRLPSELLLEIFEYLVSHIYSELYGYDNFMPTVFSGSSYISRPDQGQIALITAILTCRRWYNVGTKVLYRRPFLLSPERIVQFARAISGSPELAAFVEDMCILEQELHPALAPRETVTTKLQCWNTNRVVRKRLIECIEPLQLKSITFAFRGGSFKDNWNILPLDDEFIRKTSIGSKLRKLTLIGAGSISFQQTTAVLPSDLVLPILEYLCLRELLLSPDYQFPTLPKLHTLQMGQCFFLADTTSYTLFVTETSLPALTTLELYAVTFVVHISPKLMRQLTMINQMDNYDLPTDSSKWQKQSDFRTLRHLGHRYIAKSLATSTASYYPPTLETLTVVFPHIPSLYVDSKRVLSSLNPYLFNTPFTPGLKKFSIILSIYEIPDGFDLTSIIGDIQDFCISRGVEFEVIHEGLNSWIVGRLSGGYTNGLKGVP